MPNATRRAHRARLLAPLWAVLLGCSPPSGAGSAADAGASADAADPVVADAAPGQPDAETPTDGTCPAGGAGLACLMALVDEVGASCDGERLDDLRTSLARRHGDLPAWYEGRAVFVSYGGAVAIAGTFNDWSSTALVTGAVCGSDIYLADTTIASGRHLYKVVDGADWQLDPENWAFAYDDFAGNADGANSVLNTYDSGVGHLVHPDVEVCSTELGNCRRFYTYLPPGYGAPDNANRQYPALFMHDGQNIFDDHDCCFGHTGWELNVRLDADIASGQVEPVVVVGFPHAGADRGDEYAYAIAAGGRQETFMAFQVGTVQPRAAQLWRLDSDRYFVAGSSFGGLVSFHLAFSYPDVYAGAASLSGSFWVGADDGTAMSDTLTTTGYFDMPLYLDHGGTAQSGGDNYTDNVALLGQLVGAGWTRADSPSCTMAPGALCYFHDVGATHDELAWRDRNQRFLRFLLAP